jgi:hypothetical protein
VILPLRGTTNDLFYIPRDASDVIISNRGHLQCANLLNSFDSGNGLVQYATFNGIAPASAVVDPVTGKWNYTLNTIVTAPATNPRFSWDDLRSRWQGQLGFNFRF